MPFQKNHTFWLGKRRVLVRMKDINPDKVYNLSEVCKLLQRPKTTIFRYIKQGRIKSVRRGRFYEIFGFWVLDFIREEKIRKGVNKK